MAHLTQSELEAGLDHVRAAPRDEGIVELVVRRPDVDAREVVDVAELDTVEGLVGDSWRRRGSTSTEDGSAHPDAQITMMNARFVELVAQEPERWKLAGDQLYVDLDLGAANLPPGTRLTLGTAEIEITAKPHTGCAKFAGRFGVDALRLVNATVGRELRLRGVNARVVRSGTVRRGDAICKL